MSECPQSAAQTEDARSEESTSLASGFGKDVTNVPPAKKSRKTDDNSGQLFDHADGSETPASSGTGVKRGVVDACEEVSPNPSAISLEEILERLPTMEEQELALIIGAALQKHARGASPRDVSIWCTVVS